MKKYVKPEITVVEMEAEAILAGSGPDSNSLDYDANDVNDVNRVPSYGRFYDDEE